MKSANPKMGEKMTLKQLFLKAHSIETNKYFCTIFSRWIDILKMHVVAKFQCSSIYSSSIILKRKLCQLLCLQSKHLSKRYNVLTNAIFTSNIFLSKQSTS